MAGTWVVPRIIKKIRPMHISAWDFFMSAIESTLCELSIVMSHIPRSKPRGIKIEAQQDVHREI